MDIQLLDEKIVIKGKQNIEINYEEISSVALKVKQNRIRLYILVSYLLSSFFIFTSLTTSIYIMIAYVAILLFLLFYKFDKIKANAVLIYKNKKLKMALDNKDLDIMMKLIDRLKFNYYKKHTTINN